MIEKTDSVRLHLEMKSRKLISMINNLVEFEVNYVHINRKINRHPQ